MGLFDEFKRVYKRGRRSANRAVRDTSSALTQLSPIGGPGVQGAALGMEVLKRADISDTFKGDPFRSSRRAKKEKKKEALRDSRSSGLKSLIENIRADKDIDKVSRTELLKEARSLGSKTNSGLDFASEDFAVQARAIQSELVAARKGTEDRFVSRRRTEEAHKIALSRPGRKQTFGI